MLSHRALRHVAVAAIAAVTVLANVALGVAWLVALIAGTAVLLFGELSPRLMRPGGRPPATAQPPASDAERAGPGAYPLTRKEVEVAILVAQGKTNKEIATRLFNSERTIDNHVQHIYNKLNIDSRAELALWVQARGLLTPAIGAK
jgi:DNA-binding NarL/FixJ family response regulator